jgi:hypothetical protein
MGDKLSISEAKAMELLLHFDALRGKHSTGVAVAKKHGALELYKEVGPPDFLYRKFPDKFVQGRLMLHDTMMVMGHNRWATQGLINEESAHPFNFTNIVGAHNGTVNLFSLKDFPGHKHFQIDSQIICSHLDQGSLQDLWDKADGAMALSWWDKNEHVLNLARNKERPLHYAITPDKSTLYWASEDWFIWLSTGRNGIKLKDEDVQEIEEDTHYKFKMVDGKVEVDKIKLNPFVRPTPSYQNHGGKGYGTTTSASVEPYNKYHTDEFLLESWHPTIVQNVKGKKIPTQGFFEGSNFQYETVRVVVKNVTQEILDVIKDIEEENMWSTWKCSKMEWNMFKKSKEWFHLGYWDDTKMVWDYKTNSSTMGKVITLDNYKTKKEEESPPEFAPFMGMMIPRAQWETNINKCKGCAQCGADASWEERKTMRWWYQGSEIVFDCPTCLGTYN